MTYREKDPQWRELEGIERDITFEISPWLKARSRQGGDPADRMIVHARRLIEMVRDAQPPERTWLQKFNNPNG